MLVKSIKKVANIPNGPLPFFYEFSISALKWRGSTIREEA
jgi:hypothetical protein